jgi:hypothetical protein
MKYRLVKKTLISGFVLYQIERHDWVIWPFRYWCYVDSYADKEKALQILSDLRNGMPPETREVIDE